MSKKPNSVRPTFTAHRCLCNAYVEYRGEHFATMLDFEAAKEFARILSELEVLSSWSGAFVESGDGAQARWRMGGLIARHFGVSIDYRPGGKA
ncbi:hypothetical protein N6H05_01465 [Sphingobium sp. WTD-1]|uniref:hypothetical protein n=1 Tax=Sphingobium sp. WTD-1 TaxID=2979467 RepID=UPI0024DEEA03|nr:hypothetical protein [Sphingobium sp. WTD-1]WIA56521.1 hypothetical protein N6H05_01465 [Sphingobium sp. WTD-1]